MNVQGIINPTAATAYYVKDREEQCRKREFIKLSTISFVVALFNAFFCNNKFLSLGLVCVEVGILLFLLMQHRYAEYFIFYTIFLSLSLEFEYFVGASEFYGIKNFRIFGLNLGVWLALPLIAVSLLNIQHIIKRTKDFKNLNSISSFLITLLCLASVVGGISILINDNNVSSMEGIWSLFGGELYSFSFLPIVMISAIYIILADDRCHLWIIPIGLQAILIGCVCQETFAMIFGIDGQYGGNTIALSTAVSTFIPFLICLPFFLEKMPYPKITFFIGVIGILVEFMNGGGGKGIIITGICFLLIVIKLITSKKGLQMLIGVLIFAIGILLIIVMLRQTTNKLLSWKMYNVVKLFDFGSNWLENLPNSPKIRVAEFVDIFMEFFDKPLYFLTGKGFLGTVKDYCGLLGNELISVDAFTRAEWNVGSFYGMHEYASILLTFGLPGLVFTVKYILLVVKNYRHSAWLIVGLYWFVIYYGFSFTIGVFGAAVFFYSIVETDIRKIRET